MLKIKSADQLLLTLFLFVLPGILILIPYQTRAMNMSYGGWGIDGFLRNNTGIWTENWDYTTNNDPLATCRNWLRLNLNGDISDSLSLKAETLAIYEPEYSRERGGGIAANEYNSFDFREMRLDWHPIYGHSIRIGKQIVNWGESISARVGDVINPVDSRFDLGFTNLEDTRIPIWMIRGIHDFTSIRSTLDWVFSPYMEPDRYRVSRSYSWDSGRIDIDGNWNGVAKERFTPNPETRIYLNGVGYLTSSQVVDTGLPGVMPRSVWWAPFNQVMYTEVAPGLYGLTGYPNPTSMDYPDSNLKDSRYGFKTSTSVAGWQTGVYFWRAHMHSPPVAYYQGAVYPYGPAGPAIHNFKFVWERQNVYGFYGNKNFDFGVVRMDIAYRPNMEFQTTRIDKHPDMVCEEDNLKFQMGYNKDFMIYTLNPNQPFSLISEYVGDYLVSGDSDGALFALAYHIKKPRDSHEFMLSLGTNYNFGMFSPNLTVIYNVKNNGLIQPSITCVPDWMGRKWSFKLQYCNLFGDHDLDYVYGLYRGKDNVILTTQFSFP